MVATPQESSHTVSWTITLCQRQQICKTRLNPTSMTTPPHHRQPNDCLTTRRQPVTPICPKEYPGKQAEQVHWLSMDLVALRQSANKLRRAHQRSARWHDQQEVAVHREAYIAKRKELRNFIRDAQAKSWSDLSKAFDNDPWGLPRREVTKKFGRKHPGIEACSREPDIADRLFLNLPATNWSLEPQPPEEADDSPRTHDFTLAELCESIWEGHRT